MDSGCSCSSWWQRPRREVTSFKSHIPLSDLSLPWTLPDTQLPEDLSGRWLGGWGGAHRALVRGCAPEKTFSLGGGGWG